MRAVRKYLALGWTDRLLLIEAWLYLGAARLALLAVPFRYIAPHLGVQIRPTAVEPPGSEAVPPEARRLAGAVEIMSRHTPWESACLAQAMAGKWMLRRRGLFSRLYLGTKKEPSGELKAHAWLQSADEILIGGAGHETFVVLSAFADAGGAEAP